MSPKEKAKELYVKYYDLIRSPYNKHYHVNQCALIAVDEIIKAFRKDLPEVGLGKGYWYDVREEIGKL